MSEVITAKYGVYTLEGIAESLRISGSYTDFTCDFTLLIMETSPGSMQAAYDNVVDNLRNPNRKIEFLKGGNSFFAKDPSIAVNDASMIRCKVTPLIQGASSASCTISITGNLSAIEATGDFIPNWQATISQAQRISFTFAGIYTAKGATSAQSLFDNETIGAEAKAELLLASLFATRRFMLVESGLTEPQQDTNQWIQFSLRYIEKLLPDALDSDDYDFTGLVITKTAMPIGTPITGKALSETFVKGGSIAAHRKGTAFDPDIVYKYSVRGDIIIKSEQRNYQGMVDLWQNQVLGRLNDFLAAYFFSKYSGSPKIVQHSVSYDTQMNTITVDLSFLLIGSAGILEFGETVGIQYDPRNVVEYYLNGKDDFDAWEGKMPSKVTSSQNIRVTTLVEPELPPPPKIPAALISFLKVKAVSWLSTGFQYTSLPLKYPMEISIYGGFTVYTVTYNATYQLVKTVSSKK